MQHFNDIMNNDLYSFDFTWHNVSQQLRNRTRQTTLTIYNNLGKSSRISYKSQPPWFNINSKQVRAPNSQPFEVICYAESSMYLKSFVTANGQLFNLYKFVFSITIVLSTHGYTYVYCNDCQFTVITFRSVFWCHKSVLLDYKLHLASRPWTVPSPKSFRTKVVIRDSTECFSCLALSLKQGEYPYESDSHSATHQRWTWVPPCSLLQINFLELLWKTQNVRS